MTFFVAPANSILCLRAMNQLHDIPIASRCLCRIKKTIISNLLNRMHVTTQGNKLDIKEVSTEETINWSLHLHHSQGYIALHNQNQTLKLVPLWEVCVYITDGPDGADVS